FAAICKASWRFCVRGRLVAVLKAIGCGSLAGDCASVVTQQIVEMARISWIGDPGRIRIRDERMLGQRSDSAAVIGVEIHVFVETIGVEEIIADPTASEFWQ